MQPDCFQGHYHKPLSSSERGVFAVDFGFGIPANLATGAGVANWEVSTGEPVPDNVHGTPRVGYETRPVNFTVKVWNRIA